MGKHLPIFIMTFAIFIAQPGTNWAALPSSLTSELDDLISGNAQPAIATFGLALDHRPYQPATPLGLSGFDLGVEVTLAHVPQDFLDALDSAGIGSDSIPPSLPIAKIHLQKGISSRIDVGVSYIGYQGNLSVGGDIKVTVHQPEEGLAVATRFSFNYAQIDMFKLRTYTLAVLASKRFSFADPYFGFGYSFVSGTISVSQLVGPSGFQQTYTQSVDESARSYMFIIGNGFRLGPTGIKITLEGTLSQASVHTLGTKIGFSF